MICLRCTGSGETVTYEVCPICDGVGERPFCPECDLSVNAWQWSFWLPLDII